MADTKKDDLTESVAATAATILFDQGKLDALYLLLTCRIELRYFDSGTSFDNESFEIFRALMSGPYTTVKGLLAQGSYFSQTAATADPPPVGPQWDILRALQLAEPTNVAIQSLVITVTPEAPGPDWRERLLEAIRGGDVSNQGVGIDKGSTIRVYEGLRYRSESEVRIAQAFERVGAMYFPNCKARLGKGQRYIREPDFLVFHNGKWGILEVDGEPYHPPSRAAQDHARDRMFRDHGNIFIEHFDAKECYNNAVRVVDQFLKHLAQS